MPKRTLVALGVLLLLSACGGTDPDAAPEVATLTTPDAAVSATPVSGAPVVRPDTTWDEQRVMQQPFMTCVRDKGLPVVTDEKGLLDLAPPDGRRLAFSDPAYGDCQKLWPVLSPELDEDKNPYWADDDENYHKCLVAGGKPLVKVDGQWRPGPGFDTWEPDEAMEMECQAAAFDGKKG
ncbi:hypothetical protein [Catenuloplanes japonicus]|uniref:hypothetical protein n=1 Tax=Catenuloplanes japonicus TaxID=33876 RepID=UPI000526870A|nr:hypothetical protein [Catenuloplanes japonicus]